MRQFTWSARSKAAWRTCHQEMVAEAFLGMGSCRKSGPSSSVSCASVRPPVRCVPVSPPCSQVSLPRAYMAHHHSVSAPLRLQVLKDRAYSLVLHYTYAAIASEHTHDVRNKKYDTFLQCTTGEKVRSALAPYVGITQTGDV